MCGIRGGGALWPSSQAADKRRLEMRRQYFTLFVALVAVSLTPLMAQSQKPASASKAPSLPRTPDGRPDLQGVYSNATSVPVARPANLGAKEFYTDEADRTASRQPAGGGGA